eukprot:TRINITY_DN7076_c0_g1_i1.p1 TRINITY_DN7076_c0_g1~~TRINITY_DN7076_c0_g1_i1.p1  ORF type:complete len:247 (+),score=36.86 TRINITY_DN7076_c0_g1_i1:606-1346(+)
MKHSGSDSSEDYDDFASGTPWSNKRMPDPTPVKLSFGNPFVDDDDEEQVDVEYLLGAYDEELQESSCCSQIFKDVQKHYRANKKSPIYWLTVAWVVALLVSALAVLAHLVGAQGERYPYSISDWWVELGSQVFCGLLLIGALYTQFTRARNILFLYNQDWQQLQSSWRWACYEFRWRLCFLVVTQNSVNLLVYTISTAMFLFINIHELRPFWLVTGLVAAVIVLTVLEQTLGYKWNKVIGNNLILN